MAPRQLLMSFLALLLGLLSVSSGADFIAGPPEYAVADAAASTNTTNEGSHRIAKRWYSAWRDNDPRRGPLGPAPKPWPSPCGVGFPNQPVWGNGERWLRYCFASQSSQIELEDVVLHAIALWAPSFRYSSLRELKIFSSANDTIRSATTLPVAKQVKAHAYATGTELDETRW
ncbi:hypothetical protein LTR37_009255 [Vermiconidia calcicola]|uniref:Uncharacterized protein n=1 Tax=Vermiconidia calcicola TaxID=1690605 RepID=A0ACC3N8K0_9PEZI|nr:hypothetical protein LTR37_009255 [Vermiconidia calcicola]